MKRWFCLTFFAAAVSLASGAEPMNVVFILADDLGWADTTLYGHTRLYETPNLERLAKRGMTFNRAYVPSPLCSPTRASILTGWNPARTGLTTPSCHLPKVILKASVAEKAPPGDKALKTVSVSRLNTNLPTLGKILREGGYSTGHFGKWHLGPEPYSPLEHGFDVDIPHWSGPGPAGSFVAPWKFKNFKENYPKEHIEDRMAEEAVKWMKSVKGGKPFFMNYWQFSVHAPFNAKEDLIERYRKKIDPNDPQRSPTYAAMVHSLDDAVGSLLDAIDAAGIAERTAIVFISDNGGNMYNEVDGTTPTSNAPLRGGKATVFEGGIRVPCIVVWPGITEPGSRSNEIIQAPDFYPTILNLLGLSLPQNHPLDGIDITPALRGGKLKREAIFTYFPHATRVPDWLPPSVCAHSGDWKLIRLFHQGENGAHDYRLYNLAEDIGEKNNLAATYPEKVCVLDGLIEDFLKRTGAVVPQPNPAFDPAQYHPEEIGVQKGGPKKSGGEKNTQAARSSTTVSGWQSRKDCSLKKDGDGLLMVSRGKDPGLETTFNPCRVARIQVRMKADTGPNKGDFFWKKKGEQAIAGRVSFDVPGKSKWRTHTLKLPEPVLVSFLRIDPIRSAGNAWIEEILLLDEKNNETHKWSFK